jgi:heme-degrading monooxygenase HmoA
MYLHMAISRIDPQQIEGVVRSLERQAHLSGLYDASGLRQCWWVEALDDPGGLIWLSTWDSLADCQTFLSSPAYSQWTGAVQIYLETEPHWVRYRVLAGPAEPNPE